MEKNFKTKGGFTIIETMISVSLFIVVLMAGMGALLNANLLQQKSQDMRSIIDSLSFVMEDMSRSLRTGYDYRCFDTLGLIAMGIPKSCANGWAIAFKPQDYNASTNNNQVVYYFGANPSDPSGNTYSIFKSYNNGVNYVQLTPNEVVIDKNYGFSVLGAEPPIRNLTPPYSPYYSGGNFQQPFVTIKLVGTINSKGVTTPFSLQTSVSQRNMDRR